MNQTLYNKSLSAIARITSAHMGWRTNKKIIVVESDDWGSARLPNIDSQRRYETINAKASSCAYLQYDCLETAGDLDRIGDVLLSLRDVNDRPLCLTPNYIMVNPDFSKIAADSFQNFHYEEFTRTIERNSCDGDPINKINDLIKLSLWKPQLHGREHVNISRWLAALRDEIPEITAAFECEIYGVSRQCAKGLKQSLLEAYAIDDTAETEDRLLSIAEGRDIFRKVFGYCSKSFIPPNYIIAPMIHANLAALGVEGLQGLSVIKRPAGKQQRNSIRILGRRDRHELITLIRNVFFEPTLYPQKDTVDLALTQIDRAFGNRKPAVICSHRLNFMGGISLDNRDRGLRALNSLITRARAAWPDIEFMSTCELLREINEEGTNA